MTAILGISAFYHDSAAALVVDGTTVAAVQEERFTRKKYDARFPAGSVEYCLKEAGISLADVDYVVFYEKPFAKFERLLETYLAFAPRGFQSFSRSIPLWLKERLYMGREIPRRLNGFCKTHPIFLSHHESHAASAFFPSPFEKAAILTMDGVGEWSTTTFGIGEGNGLKLLRNLRFPHSLGLLYTAFTYYCGFKVNSGEYKLMGLAPYGRPTFKQAIYENLVRVKRDGSFWLNIDYFNYCQGLTMTNDRFHRLFGGPPRKPESPIEKRHMDLAASIQAVTEEIVMMIGDHIHTTTGMKNLVLAGGVALNCVANGRLLREGLFEKVWIQPAAGDAGGALGAALFVWHQLLGQPREATNKDRMNGSFLGPVYSDQEVRKSLDESRAVYHHFYDESELLDRVSELLASGKIVGWFQGRTEFGPRALGARSILGDPRSANIQRVMNQKIKYRESFRPFAPSVLREHVHEWFTMEPYQDSPYMLLVTPVLERHRLSGNHGTEAEGSGDLLSRLNALRSSIPAVTHVDYSARVQTVDERHGRYYRLIKKFWEKTGCPILVNTSFNLSWEPIVLTPSVAFRTFMQSDMEALVLENFLLFKKEQRLGIRFWCDGAAKGPPADSPWADPFTGEPLIVTKEAAKNPKTGDVYPVEEGIPRLFSPAPRESMHSEEVTERVKMFYERVPFPSYDEMDDIRALLEKARRGGFARLLNEQIPYDARVLEVGCGTGQLTNFLSVAHRTVLGTDICFNSLRLAQKFKEQHGLERAVFAQMNLFRPALRRDFFDVVICNGVLHHTTDPKAGFSTISRLVRPGGYLVVGLYNSFSRRLAHAPRVILHRVTGITGRWLDPRFRELGLGSRGTAWFQDQYCHPHESCHTIDELLSWFDEAGMDFVNGIPKPAGGQALAFDEVLFSVQSPGNRLTRFLSQLRHVGDGYREGGFFIMIGQRRKVAQVLSCSPSVSVKREMEQHAGSAI